MVDKLLENSKYAMFAAIEIHNKPIFPYRYQICTVSIINAWELLLKAYILVYHKEVRVISNDGKSKPFEECLAFVKAQLGSDFSLQSESIERLYQYRCEYIHFYSDNIDTILYSLIAKGVDLYNQFSIKHFQIDLSNEVNLILLPIGFTPPVSPIDFLSNKSNINESSKEVQEFINSIIVSTANLAEIGVEEPILYSFNMALINENRIKNADIVAAISKEGEGSITLLNMLQNVKITSEASGKLVRIQEESLYNDLYKMDSALMRKKAKEIFNDVVENNRFKAIIKEAKTNPSLYKERFLNPNSDSGMRKGFYTEAIFEFLAKYYTKR